MITSMEINIISTTLRKIIDQQKISKFIWIYQNIELIFYNSVFIVRSSEKNRYLWWLGQIVSMNDQSSVDDVVNFVLDVLHDSALSVLFLVDDLGTIGGVLHLLVVGVFGFLAALSSFIGRRAWSTRASFVVSFNLGFYDLGGFIPCNWINEDLLLFHLYSVFRVLCIPFFLSDNAVVIWVFSVHLFDVINMKIETVFYY